MELLKTLVLLRHAESEWNIYGKDKDRRLTERGREDAAFIAGELSDKNISPGIIICSPAARTIETANYLMHLQPRPNAKMQLTASLYPGSVFTLCQSMLTIPDRIEQAIIVAHNPVLSDLINEWSLRSPVNLAPGSAFACCTECDNWSNFAAAEKKFLFYIRPHGYE